MQNDIYDINRTFDLKLEAIKDLWKDSLQERYFQEQIEEIKIFSNQILTELEELESRINNNV